ncbi:hypothetical protein GMMP1_220001 [Candidatus Magnetomoraceae bacterium gMMP-1]
MLLQYHKIHKFDPSIISTAKNLWLKSHKLSPAWIYYYMMEKFSHGKQLWEPDNPDSPYNSSIVACADYMKKVVNLFAEHQYKREHAEYKVEPISFEEYKRHIDAKHPVLINSKTMNHVICGIGYKIKHGQAYAVVHDPYGQKQENLSRWLKYNRCGEPSEFGKSISYLFEALNPAYILWIEKESSAKIFPEKTTKEKDQEPVKASPKKTTKEENQEPVKASSQKITKEDDQEPVKASSQKTTKEDDQESAKPLSEKTTKPYYTKKDLARIVHSTQPGIDLAFITAEHNVKSVTTGYIPKIKADDNGVNIASGVDLGHRSKEDFMKLELSENLMKKFIPYLGLQKGFAQSVLQYQPLEITKKEAKIIDEAVIKNLIKQYNKSSKLPFKKLPSGVQTVIASLGFQYGDLKSKAPKFWSYVIKGNWEGAYHNLKNFGDNYPLLRNKEAELLKESLIKEVGITVR